MCREKGIASRESSGACYTGFGEKLARCFVFGAYLARESNRKRISWNSEQTRAGALSGMKAHPTCWMGWVSGNRSELVRPGVNLGLFFWKTPAERVKFGRFEWRERIDFVDVGLSLVDYRTCAVEC